VEIRKWLWSEMYHRKWEWTRNTVSIGSGCGAKCTIGSGSEPTNVQGGSGSAQYCQLARESEVCVLGN
jgi:hypothetical protein